MKKNTKLLIGSAIGVGILGAALAVVLMLPSQNEQIEVVNDDAILLFDKQNLEPEDITVKNESGEYQLLGYQYKTYVSQKASESKTSSAASSETANDNDEEDEDDKIKMIYTMQDHPNETLSKTLTDSLYEECCYMAATKIIDRSGNNYKEYGLDSPRAEISVIYSDNSSIQMQLGNEAPDNMGVYFKLGENKNVYLVPANLVDVFFVDKLQMFDKNISSVLDEKSFISGLEVKGQGYKNELIVSENKTKTNSGKYIMDKPYRASCSDERVRAIGESLYGFEGTEIAAVEATEEDIKKFGLDKPFEQITAKADDDTYVTIVASEKDSEGKCYLMNPTQTKIFRMDVSELEWYGIGKNDLLTDAILSPDLNHINTMNIAFGENDFKYVFKYEEAVGMDYTENIITTVYLGGIQVNYSNVSQYLYNLGGLKNSDDVAKKPDGSREIFSIELTFNETEDTDCLKLYRTSDNKTIAVLNDQPGIYVDSEYADKVIEQAKLVPEKNLIDDLLEIASSESQSESSK